MTILYLLIYSSGIIFPDTQQTANLLFADTLPKKMSISGPSQDTVRNSEDFLLSIDSTGDGSLFTSGISSADTSGKKISWSAQIMAFSRAISFKEKPGTVNPGNRIAKLNKFDGGLYLRPEIKYETDLFGVWMKPRLTIDADADEKNFFRSDNYTLRFYLQELKAKWQINKSLYLLAGRYIKFLGTSAFFNPSNPFIIDNIGMLNPKLEIEPMDFVELNMSTKTDWSFSLIANVGDANKAIFRRPFLQFKRSYGVFAEYYGQSSNLGFLATMDEAKRYHLGWYAHKSLSEAVVIWTDCALDYNINRFYPVAGHATNLINYEMVNGNRNNRLFFTGLVGFSYTSKAGPTLQVNYLYNGKGYNKNEFNSYREMIKSSSNYNFDVTKELSSLNLGRALNTGTLYLRHHYVFSQLGESDLFDQLNYNIRYLYSFDDRGSQASGLVEWNVKNNLELYCLMLGNFGSKTDLNKLIRFQIMLGLIFKI